MGCCMLTIFHFNTRFSNRNSCIRDFEVLKLMILRGENSWSGEAYLCGTFLIVICIVLWLLKFCLKTDLNFKFNFHLHFKPQSRRLIFSKNFKIGKSHVPKSVQISFHYLNLTHLRILSICHKISRSVLPFQH